MPPFEKARLAYRLAPLRQSFSEASEAEGKGDLLINRLEKIAMRRGRHFTFPFGAIIFSVRAYDKTRAILALRYFVVPIFFIIRFNFVRHEIIFLNSPPSLWLFQ